VLVFSKTYFVLWTNFVNRKTESHGSVSNVFGKESSNSINFSTDMWWSCSWIYGIVKLFSGLYICNLLKCLTKEKVMGEIFEDQIFCANVHKGNVKTASSRPIIGHMQILKRYQGHLGCMLAHVLWLKKIQAEFCILSILANTKNIQAYRQLIWNVGSQNNVLTTGAPVHHDFIS
jgi:hypothetical protein